MREMFPSEGYGSATKCEPKNKGNEGKSRYEGTFLLKNQGFEAEKLHTWLAVKHILEKGISRHV